MYPQYKITVNNFKGAVNTPKWNLHENVAHLLRVQNKRLVLDQLKAGMVFVGQEINLEDGMIKRSKLHVTKNGIFTTFNNFFLPKWKSHEVIAKQVQNKLALNQRVVSSQYTGESI